jgi:adenylate kinase
MSANPSQNLLSGKLIFPFVAPPNGGKGTQTRILSERYHLPTFDMGGTFRAILKEGKAPELAAELKSFMEQGKLVPIQTVLKVFTEGFLDLVNRYPDAKGYILDGFPRNVEQAEGLMTLCEQWQAQVAKVIYLKVSMQVVEQRATGRRFCSRDAAHVYNIHEPRFMPKSKKLNPDGTVAKDAHGQDIWLCELDQAELIVRPDDEPQTVQKRLKEYAQETDPLVETFRQAGLLAEVDGEQPADKVTQDIEAVLQPLLGLTPTV